MAEKRMPAMIHTFCLAYNLTDEIAEKMRLFRQQNGYEVGNMIVDLGFPLKYGSDIPEDIQAQVNKNSQQLESISRIYECGYWKLNNVGVSQNWSEVYNDMCIGRFDVLIGIEPDEKPLTPGYCNAMEAVLMSDKKIALVSLLMKEQEDWLKQNPQAYTEEIIEGHRCYIIHGTMSMAMIGFSGKFLNEIGGIPVPEGTSIYGNIESASYGKIKEHGYRWCFLADYYVEHQENCPLYRSYKTDVTSGKYAGAKQITFDKWIELQK